MLVRHKLYLPVVQQVHLCRLCPLDQSHLDFPEGIRKEIDRRMINSKSSYIRTTF